MDPDYKKLHQEAQKLLFRYQDTIDKPDHEVARAFRKDLQRLEDDIQVSKSPRSVDSIVVNLQRQAQRIQDAQDPVMSRNHADEFYDRLEDMRQQLQKHPRY